MLEYECMKKELATHDGELLSNKKGATKNTTEYKHIVKREIHLHISNVLPTSNPPRLTKNTTNNKYKTNKQNTITLKHTPYINQSPTRQINDQTNKTQTYINQTPTRQINDQTNKTQTIQIYFP